jgi:hypothetical protein
MAVARLVDLPTELLLAVTTHVCGGTRCVQRADEGGTLRLVHEPVHDLTLWRQACRLAWSCKTLRDAVLLSPHCTNCTFDAEHVGPGLANGDEPHSVSALHLSRNVNVSRGVGLTPTVLAEFRYGMVVGDYVHSIVALVPLRLDDVLSVFRTPPGWKKAALLTLTNDPIGWHDCFEPRDYPEGTVDVRIEGKIKCKIEREREKPDENGWLDHFEVDASWAMSDLVRVVATCSTGLERFKRETRAHYLDDLELELVDLFSDELMQVDAAREFMAMLDASRLSLPTLAYRWPAAEARRLAGYPVHDHRAIQAMVVPPRSKQPKTKGPEQREAFLNARAASQKQAADMALGEKHGTIGPEFQLPAFKRSKPAKESGPGPSCSETESEHALLSSDDESDCEHDASFSSSDEDFLEALLKPPSKRSKRLIG